MASLIDYRNEQLIKLKRLKEKGINPYPAQSESTTSIGPIIEAPDGWQKQTVSIAGRLLAKRGHGRLIFCDIEDSSGRLQVLVRSEKVKFDRSDQTLGLDEINLLTRGDFVEASGVIGRSQRGELSLFADRVRLLSKVLRPLPEELATIATRRRRRYLDLAINPEVRDRFRRRSRFWQTVREYLDDAGFIEINTPVLELTTGGADARPFQTNMAALDDQRFYMRISHELPLKRLIGGGFEKVYDIGPRFRNENYSDEHLPEHIAAEWYWAYADWQASLDFVEDLFAVLAEKTFSRLKFDYQGEVIDFGRRPWPQIDYAATIAAAYDGLDVFAADIDKINSHLDKHGLTIGPGQGRAAAIDKLWKRLRQDHAGPVWLMNTPLFLSPLSKADPTRANIAQRFQAVVAGTELFNGYSELNDPLDQLERFKQQQARRLAGDDEAQMLDIDYVEMLEYGLPPTVGFGISERMFWILEGVPARDGVPFVHLRPETSPTTKTIYPDLFAPGGLLAESGQETTPGAEADQAATEVD